MVFKYTPLEEIPVFRPVDRISYIVKESAGKNVLDIGCLDETALCKIGTKYFLHERIAQVAKFTVGIDNSLKLIAEFARLRPNGRIIKADACVFDKTLLKEYDFEIIVAGEFIEHLDNALFFLHDIKKNFAGKKLIFTTPNAVSLSNILLAILKRESTHEGHLQIYSYKTLNTLCLKAGFESWKIIPYYVSYAEMILASKGLKAFCVKAVEKSVNFGEYLLPLLSGGFIVDAYI